MLKRLAIAVLLMELSLPVNGQGKARHSEGNNEHTQQDSDPSIAVTVHCSETPVQQEHSPKEANGTRDKSESYFKTLISANNLPNDLLFLVGLTGVCIAIWTLLTIKSQVDTFISKERARVTVDIQPLKPNGEDEIQWAVYDKSPIPPPASGKIWYADLLISNSGETNAFVGHSLCKAYIRATGWNPQEEIFNSSIGLPKVMHPHTSPFEYRVRVETGNALRWEVDKETAKGIGDGSLGIYVLGHIEFGDVFGNQWTVKFCRKWGAWWFGGKWQGADVWYDYPDDILPEESRVNGEFRIKAPSMLRRISRRMRKDRFKFPEVKIS